MCTSLMAPLSHIILNAPVAELPHTASQGELLPSSAGMEQKVRCSTLLLPMSVTVAPAVTLIHPRTLRVNSWWSTEQPARCAWLSCAFFTPLRDTDTFIITNTLKLYTLMRGKNSCACARIV